MDQHHLDALKTDTQVGAPPAPDFYPGGTKWDPQGGPGDEPAAPQRTTDFGTPTEPKRSWWQRLGFGFVLVRVVVGVLIVGGSVVGYFSQADRDGSGAITDAGDLAATELRVGDCFNAPEGEIADVAAVPCSQPHGNEVFLNYTIPGDQLPSDGALQEIVQTQCLPAFQTYVGVPIEQSELTLTWLSPSSDGWAAGDHVLTCVIFDEGQSLTGSAKGTAS